jgi:hypothetical protein
MGKDGEAPLFEQAAVNPQSAIRDPQFDEEV